MPWQWALRINGPDPPPDGLPKFLALSPSIVNDDPNIIDVVRTIMGATSEWDLRIQFYWDVAAPLPGSDYVAPRVRFEWVRRPELWLSGEDLSAQSIGDATLYQPSFTCPNNGAPPWPSGQWIESVTVGGLAWDGDDALAEFRAGWF